ncbi:MAG TPA: FtsQ-type POTRA domain-containing protein [Balneolales bacterium]|nr:FtsQ-type POTRA domain-containing protein [Balneolales bacterium]
MSDINNLFSDPSPGSDNKTGKNRNHLKQLDQSDQQKDNVEKSTANDDKELGNNRSGHKIKGRYVLIAVLLVIGATFLGYYATKAVIIKNITVDGQYFSNQKDIIAAARVPMNVAPDSINFLKIIKNVEKLPYVKEAYIRVVPPTTLHIHVLERKPIAMLVNGANKMYVDADGVKLPIINGKAVDAPLLYGFQATGAGDTLKSDRFHEVSNFLTDANKHDLAGMTISELGFSKKEGIVALSQDNGVKLIFGKKDFNERLSYWDAFYKQVIPRKGIDKFLSVDLRYKGQIVTHEL